MNIAFLNSWWQQPATGSGTTVGISGLADGLTTLGHKVELVGPHGGVGTLGRLLFNLSLPKRLKSRRYDLVVGFDWDGFLFTPPADQPYVVNLKGVVADEARFERGWSRFMLRRQATLERRNAAKAARVLTPSYYSRHAALTAYGLAPERVTAVPEGIHLKSWPRRPPHPPEKPLCARPVILSVARQYPRKNTRTLLWAMPRVLQAFPGATLRVVGGGPALKGLKKMTRDMGLEKSITFLGAMPDDNQVRAEYYKADLFCLPSFQEGFGIVLLEAMAAGLPVVAGNRGAIPELIAHDRTGLLADADDHRALSDSLVRVMSDPVLAARMGSAARERARRFDWPNVAQRFLSAALT